MSKYKNLVQEYKNGKSIKNILQDNPDIKKSTLHYNIKKFENVQEQSVQDVGHVEVNDPYLNKQRWDKDESINKLFGDIIKNPTFNPKEIIIQNTDNEKKQQEKDKAEKFLSKKSFWLKQPKTKKEVEQDLETEKFTLIQQIRLYMQNFPELHDLYIVDIRDDSKPLINKWIDSLYKKPIDQLEKILHCIKFHCRNNSSDQSSGAVAMKMFEITLTVIEHILIKFNLKVQGLSNELMNDPNVKKNLTELMIEHGVNTLQYGPKVDLLLKFLMSVVSLDTRNRMLENSLKLHLSPQFKKTETENKLQSIYREDLKEKYNDL